MIHNTKTSRVQFAAALLGAVMLIVSGFVVTAAAQDTAAAKTGDEASRLRRSRSVQKI